MNILAKVALTFGAIFVLGGVKAFLLMFMWNWFVVPLFHTSEASFLMMLGLLWTVQVLIEISNSDDNPAHDIARENLLTAVLACIPEHKAAEAMQEMKENSEGFWTRAASLLAGRLFGYGVTFGLAWVLHIFV